MSVRLKSLSFSSAAGRSAVLADEASFLVNELLSAVGTALAFHLCAVGDVLFKCPFHSILPRVDVLAFQLERRDEFHDVGDRHPIAQDSAY